MPHKAITDFVLNNFLEHLFIINDKKEIIYQTNHIEKLLGFTSEEINVKDLNNLFVNPHITFNQMLEKADEMDEYFGVEYFKHKSKRSISIAFRIIKRIDEVTQNCFFIIYLKDNTHQDLLMKDLIKKSSTIENLSKSRKIREGKIDEAIHEILESSSKAMSVARVNAWLINEQKGELQCIGNYDSRENAMIPQSSLPSIDIPKYFKQFETEKILLSENTLTDPKLEELREFYLKPNHIYALMDIPVRVEGEMIGVICFENVGSFKEWTLDEQKFGLVAAQLISLTIESHTKQKAKHALEGAFYEQKILLQEVHHRVKNNLSIVASLMNLQAEKATDDYHKQLFVECRNRLDSISAVHELIYKAKSFAQLNFKVYLQKIVEHIAETYQSSKHVNVHNEIEDVNVNISNAIPLALIVNELITNSYKHAFKSKKEGVISISLNEDSNGLITLMISDNGKGFSKTDIPKSSIGLDILEGLIDQIGGTLDFISNENGTKYQISFSEK
jgi:two-component sensor histidine kinase